jgi:hypothetical protein
MKKIILKIIGQLISIVIFCVVFFTSLFITYGYRYDFEENEVIQTSVIDICTSPKTADLYLDDELYSEKACDKIFGIGIGSHDLEVKKDGYYSWNKNLYLDDEKVSLYKQILLIPHPEFYVTTIFDENVQKVWISPNQSHYAIYDEGMDLVKIFSASRSTPYIFEASAEIKNITWIDNGHIIVDTTKGRYEANIKKGDWELVSDVLIRPHTIKNNLIIKSNELWVKNGDEEIFVTRYSNAIESAQYFYNESNLLITTESDIRICDFEGENCHLITTKDKNTLVAHPVRSKKIIFVKDGVLQQLILSTPSDAALT